MTRRPLLIATIALMALSPIAGRADTPQPAAPAGEAAGASYRIAAQDELSILVVGHEDLSRTVPVLPDGKIAYPYVGEIRVEGMTVSDLAGRLRKALDEQLVNPQVTVTVSRRYVPERPVREVSVLGAVRSPGKRALRKDDWKVLDLVADAGGLSVDRPEWVTATLVRGGGAEAIPVDLARLLTDFDAKANLEIKDGDVLLIQQLDPNKIQVQVLGEVGRPGPVPVPRNGSIVDVLAAAGGPTAKAALAKATILRGTASLPVDLSQVNTTGKVPGDLKLQPGDSLVIPANKLQFAVFGAVNAPGAIDYPETEKVTVSTALVRTGGQARDADLKGATLIRPTASGEPTLTPINIEEMMKKGDFSKDVALQPGDILFVPSKEPSKAFTLERALSYVPILGWFMR